MAGFKRQTAFIRHMRDTVRLLYEQHGGNFDRLGSREQETIYLARFVAAMEHGGEARLLCEGRCFLDTLCGILDKIGLPEIALPLRQANRDNDDANQAYRRYRGRLLAAGGRYYLGTDV